MLSLIESKLLTASRLMNELLVAVESSLPEHDDLLNFAAYIKHKDNHLIMNKPFKFDEAKTLRLMDNYIKRIQLEQNRITHPEDTLRFLNAFPTRIKDTVYTQ